MADQSATTQAAENRMRNKVSMASLLLAFVTPAPNGACSPPQAERPGHAVGGAAQRRALPSRPSPEAAASAMVDIALPADWVGGYHNLAQLSSDMQSQLLDAVKKVTGKPSGLQEFLNRVKYPAYIRPLFKGGQLQTEKAKQYKSRLESLTPADIDTWKVALKNASGAESEAWSIAYGMVQIESLWEGDRLTDGTKKRSLARLASIPAASFGEWTDGAGGKEDTAVYLLQTEALFVNDRFDSELFGKAVPLAKQKYKERAEEHERASKAKAAKRQ